ncbi:electron transport complex subunit RsxC [Halomonas sp. McH1-25]|uniref:electron transport complex subunit RsxC n=1 Tax=unclassified Halomonas TaxID=2609666 RepID=UPI001EF71A2A|nr:MULTISPECIES: electron transport complex subunit RsxC [unclassified Halomonas]MCG7598792.1 electron transport complex subunit RsxC [Halomonas sp. McH1-25]MCP1340755.1 electron transport complex subunit RsxC [Halomonas sp. FL8]MCP1359526.1 electron transport complex subunit RsxC [Halomonas sp. BBD45]MCP1365167.1 electron transport complex subunit RsxC [Halomonas sp. BBD48]
MADFDFPGGIMPPERKALSNRAPLIEAPLPARVVLPLTQHVGQPAEPVVTVGQTVRTGEIVACAQGMISAPVHASITGSVTAIEERAVPHPSAAVGESKALCIVIEGNGQDDDWLRMPPLDWRSTGDEFLIERLQSSGVVGLGGAGFPTAVKAQVRRRHTIDTLIVNAAECEPYITADDLTLRTHPGDVLEGARMLARLCGAERILIGIEDNKPEAIAALRRTLSGTVGDIPVELKIVATRYPSGGERQLVQKLTGREVPSRGLPADVGVLCHNPGTLLASLRAVRDGEPMISRIVTLTGEALARPGNLQTRLGTPLHELLSVAGLRPERLSQLILGGPMMGFTLDSDALPLVKTANCLIAGTADEFPPAPAEQPCIRCGACETVCPASLLPQQLYWFSKSREHDKAELFNLFDCIECGACAYVCPSHIPLVQYYRAAKGEIRLREREARKAEHARHRFEFRQARMAREEAEKEARRQARLAQAKASRSAPEQRKTAVPSVPSDTPQRDSQDSAAELKKLKIAQAAAKAAVRKAEKALARASEGGQHPSADLDDLETQLATARENLQATEARLAALQSQTTPAATQPVPTTKTESAAPASQPSSTGATTGDAAKQVRQRKIAVASAQAAYRKAEKALESAMAQNDDAALAAAQQKLERTQGNLERARKALEEAEATASEHKDTSTP